MVIIPREATTAGAGLALSAGKVHPDRAIAAICVAVRVAIQVGATLPDMFSDADDARRSAGPQDAHGILATGQEGFDQDVLAGEFDPQFLHGHFELGRLGCFIKASDALGRALGDGLEEERIRWQLGGCFREARGRCFRRENEERRSRDVVMLQDSLSPGSWLARLYRRQRSKRGRLYLGACLVLAQRHRGCVGEGVRDPVRLQQSRNLRLA